MNAKVTLRHLLLRFWSVLEMPVRYIFGRDIFISYSRADAGKYAPNLALALQSKRPKLSFYLDKWIAPPDNKLPRSLKRHLRWSSILVLVCTENAVKSDFVRDEIRSFARLGRKVVPISVDGSFFKFKDDEELWRKISGASPEDESRMAIAEGRASDSVIERVIESVRFSIQDQRLRRAVWGSASFLVLSIAGAIIFSVVSVREANAKVEFAETQRSTAEAARDDANTKKGLAEQATKDANQKTADALVLQGIAEEKTRVATAREKAANAEADRQEQIAEARQLASESDRIRNEQGRFLLKSVSRAVRSIEINHRVGGSTSESYDALRNSVALFPEQIGALRQLQPARLKIAADDKLLVVVQQPDRPEHGMTAHVWDLNSNQKVRTIGGKDQGDVYQVSGDGNHILTTREAELIVWNSSTGSPESRIPKPHPDRSYSSLAINETGSLVAISYSSEPAYVWAVKEQRFLYSIKEIEGARKMAFSTNGIYLAAAQQESGAGITKVFYTKDGSMIPQEEPFVHEGNISSTVISPGGDYVATVSRSSQPFKSSYVVVQVWAVHENENNDVISLAVDGVQDLFFSSAQMILVASSGQVQVIDLASKNTSSIGDLSNPIARASLSPDQKYLATINRDFTVRLWDINTKREVSRMYHDAEVTGAIFNTDGSEIITAGEDNLIKRWKPATGLVARTVGGGSADSFFRTWLFSASGDLMAGNDLGSVTLWDPATGDTIKTIEPDNLTLRFALSRNSRFLVTASKVYAATNAEGGENFITLWSVSSDKKEALDTVPLSGWVKDVAVTDDGSYVLAHLDQAGVAGIVKWDLKTKKISWLASVPYKDFFDTDSWATDPLERSEPLEKQRESWETAWKKNSPAFVAISPDALSAIALFDNGNFSVFDPRSSTVRWQGHLNAAELSLMRNRIDPDRPESLVSFSINSKFFYLCFPGLVAHIFDPHSGRKVSSIKLGPKETLLKFSPQGSYVIAQPSKTSLRVLDSKSRKQILKRSGEFNIQTASISIDEKLLVSGSEDRSCEIWDLATSQRLGRIRTQTPVQDVGFSRDSNRVLTRERGPNSETSIRIWIWRLHEIEAIANRLLKLNARQERN